jgi:adenylate cyclase class 2
VPIEAELKARVQCPGQVRDQLRQRADEPVSTKQDTYFDRPDGTLTAEVVSCRSASSKPSTTRGRSGPTR